MNRNHERNGSHGGWPQKSGFPGSPDSNNRGNRRSGSWGLTIVLLLLWSALVWLGYTGLDALLTWLSASGDSLAQAGKNVGTAFGVGKEVGAVADSLKAGGLWEQAIALMRLLLKPAVVIVWLLGAVVLMVLPRLLGKIIGVFRSGRNSW